MRLSFRFVSIVVAGWALLSIAAVAVAQNTETTGQTAQNFQGEIRENVAGEYLLYLPEDYGKDPDRTWPVILFLHGSGERGSVEKVRRVGLPARLEREGDFPFIVLSPMCPKDAWWTDTDMRLTVMGMLDKVLATTDADPDRVYLTGLSMGGFGTWDLAQNHPDRFAAIAPVCGGGNPYLNQRLKNVPAMVFHGEKDKSVPLFMAKQMAGSLKSLGGEVTLRVYPHLGHSIWTEVYNDPKLYAFFRKHKR